MSSVYEQAVTHETNICINSALEREVQTTTGGMENGISMITDARHACRKNSFHSDVVAIGYKNHKVISYQHVTKDDDRVSQRHETYGTRKIYEDIEGKGVKIRIHGHDRNASVSKFVVEEKPTTEDNLDTWHCGKEVNIF